MQGGQSAAKKPFKSVICFPAVRRNVSARIILQVSKLVPGFWSKIVLGFLITPQGETEDEGVVLDRPMMRDHVPDAAAPVRQRVDSGDSDHWGYRFRPLAGFAGLVEKEWSGTSAEPRKQRINA